MTEKTEVNIPLLRKAVEWAEAEAAKPPELCEWEQRTWVIPTPEEKFLHSADAYTGNTLQAGKSEACGTCFCIAGFVQSQVDGAVTRDVEKRASELLGTGSGEGSFPLFNAFNTIKDVRRIAESLAGERL